MRILRATYIVLLVPLVVRAQGVTVQQPPEITEFCFTPPLAKHVPPITASSELRQLATNQGEVKMEVIISANGSIDQLTWVNGAERFRKISLKWANEFLFFPGIANKQAQRSKAYICIRANQANGQLQYSFGMSATPTNTDWFKIPEQ